VGETKTSLAFESVKSGTVLAAEAENFHSETPQAELDGIAVEEAVL
jgi:hypothetical protein